MPKVWMDVHGVIIMPPPGLRELLPSSPFILEVKESASSASEARMSFLVLFSTFNISFTEVCQNVHRRATRHSAWENPGADYAGGPFHEKLPLPQPGYDQCKFDVADKH